MQIDRSLQSLGTIRDGLIALVSGIYIVGYATWAIYAWRRGLGIATPLDTHYFVTGIPMAAIVTATLAAIFGLKNAVNRFLMPHLQRPRWRENIRLALVGLVLICYAVFGSIVRYHEAFETPISSTKAALLFIPAAIGFLAAAILMLVDPPDDPTIRILPRAGILLAGFLYAYFFIGYLYPVIPGALGGGAPRRAQLDLKTEHISAATLKTLCACDARGQTTVRTQDVWIYPSTGDLIVTTVRPDPVTDSRLQPMQLRRDVVAAIEWRER